MPARSRQEAARRFDYHVQQDIVLALLCQFRLKGRRQIILSKVNKVFGLLLRKFEEKGLVELGFHRDVVTHVYKALIDAFHAHMHGGFIRPQIDDTEFGVQFDITLAPSIINILKGDLPEWEIVEEIADEFIKAYDEVRSSSF